MDYSKTTPESLCRAVVENIGKKVDYPEIPLDGAKKAAQIIQEVRNAS